MIGDIVALLGLIGLAVTPLVWRVWQDRRTEAALQIQAEVQAAANRALGGESLLTVAVTAPSLRRAGQVRLSAPAGWECLIEAVWPRVMKKLPDHYELVVESHGLAMRGAARNEHAVRAAA